jgi:exopolyphosphatase/guanosine-5'-triphosphate,3'-diphosphate pyrophosphatase
MKLAAIDIGSNSIKLLIVESHAGDSFAVLAREKEFVRLGHETLRHRHLSPNAIARAADCVERFRQIIETRGIAHENIIAVATASVRNADNSSEFIAEVERRTGVRVEVISGLEEARLIGIAAAQGCAMRGERVLNIDIGGGSTELSLVENGAPLNLYSIGIGAVGLTERYITSDPVKPKDLRALREEVRAALERPRREFIASKWHKATGTSGTILALGVTLKRTHNGKNDLSETPPSSSEIAFSALEKLNDELAKLDYQNRQKHFNLSAQRAEIIIAGGQILEGVMRALKIEKVYGCDWSLREGAIIDRLRTLEAEARPPLPDIADPRLRGVHAVGLRFHYEEAHAHTVAALAEKIFDGLAAAANLNRHHRTLLSAAALLHDIGYAIAHEAHHKHTLYLIKHTELTGFSEAERSIIANVARYHRRAAPKERHPDYAALGAKDREIVWKLAAILRIAEALDRNHDGRVRDLWCVREKDAVRITIECDQPCENELWAAAQSKEVFEQAFKCKLTINRRSDFASKQKDENRTGEAK